MERCVEKYLSLMAEGMVIRPITMDNNDVNDLHVILYTCVSVVNSFMSIVVMS